MMNLSNVFTHRKVVIVLSGVFMILGLAFASLMLAQEDPPPVGDIFVNSVSDVEKNNDGKCTLREAIIAANKNKQSGGKNGECAAGKPDRPGGQGDIIVLQLPDTDLSTTSNIFTLTRTDNGSEDSSTTGDLDITSNITIIVAPTITETSLDLVPYVIEGGYGFTDRIFHILSGSLTLDQVTIRGGNAKSLGGGIYVEGGQLNMTNSTLTANRAGVSGGALYNNAIANLNYVTVKDNTVGNTGSPIKAGLVNSAAVFDPAKSLVVNNSYIDSNDCAGFIGGLAAHNLVWHASGCPASLTENVSDPAAENDKLQKITVLGDASLRPAMFALLEGSRALDNAGACVAEDQLLTERPQGSLCDIGAYEKIVINLPPVANDRTVNGNEDVSLPIDVSGDVSDPEGQLLLDSLVVTDDVDFGTLTKTGNFTFTYVPATNFAGSDSFTYQIADAAGLVDSATLTIEIASDGFIEVTNVCSDERPGSLYEAIVTANTGAEDTIVFDIQDTSCGTNVINLLSPLPDLMLPVTIDGLLTDGHFTQTNSAAYITLQGGVGNNFSGLTILDSAGGSEIRNLIILNFGGSGIVIGAVGAPSNGNTIQGNTIQNNGSGNVSSAGIVLDDGITIIEGVDNQLINNNISGNGDQAVDLGGDGQTPNDFGDPDDGANWVQNYPDITRAGPNPADNKLIIEGWLNSKPLNTYTLQFFSSPSCDSGDLTPLNDSEIQVTTDSLLPDYNAGNAYFSFIMPDAIPDGYAIRAVATDASGNSSEYSPCVRVGVGNDTWIAAMRLNNGDPAVSQFIDLFGQSRWYKIKVNPGNKVKVTLTNLPKNYDVVVFKDIYEAYSELLGPQDLNRLNAEFAGDAVAPSALSPSALSPSALSPSALSPSALSPDNFAPSALSPSALSPSALSPSALSEDVISPSALSHSALSPSALSPLVYSPSALSPSALSPSALSPSALSADVYASAQTRSLVGVSAFEDLADESIVVNTWNNSGDYYVRVRGREGAFDPHNTFTVDVQVLPGFCDDLSDALYDEDGLPNYPDHSLGIPAPLPDSELNTLILVDSARMLDPDRANYVPSEVAAVMANLSALALRPEVNGAVIDVSGDAQVSWFNDLADTHIECATGKNQVADSIKEIIDLYVAEEHPIKYIVLVGSDGMIPFYRYPDNALLGPESDYSPPALNPSASFTSLSSNMVLSQDRYGAEFGISFKDDEIPIPKIPVGRLVENPLEINTMINAYLGTTTGVVPPPQSTLVTGYDFLFDAAEQVQAELEAGTGNPATTLLTPSYLSPLDPQSWTASQLDELINQQRYDLMFLAGHFSANSALAADYATALITTDLPPTSEIDLTNSIIFSAGCHAGYNIVFEDRYPGRTFEPDWAQAFAQRGATLIAGTGYQYGDTDFIEYSERIYLEFAKELRTGPNPDGSGEVAIGDAFVRAKQTYLARTPVMRGIHEKAFLEATIFGLPFLKVDMPGARIVGSEDASIINPATDMVGVATNPGATLGLQYANLTVTPSFTPHALELRNIDNEDEVELIQADYLEGSDGFLANPGEPVLPLESANVAVDNLSLRGVGFRGGTYEDTPNIQPLVSAATTELRAVHLAFLSNVYFPLQPWSVNYFDALTSSGTETRFNVFPVQHLADEPEPNSATQRKFTAMNFRLYYNDNIEEYACNGLGDCEENVLGSNQPALAAEPTIVSVTGTVNGDSVDFEVYAVANPGVGVQSVWVTFTALNGAFYGQWQSIDLVQAVDPLGDVIDSTLWRGSLPLNGLAAADLRFIVQAVGGNGLVSRMDNVGRYYIPGGDIERLPTSVVLLPDASNSGKVGQTAVFEAELRDNNGNLFPGQLVGFGLGQETRIVRTGADGTARTEIPLLARPGVYHLTAWYQGSALYTPSTVPNPRDFEIQRQDTQISLIPSETFFSSPDADIQMLALLQDVEGRRLSEKTVIFELTPVGGGPAIYKAVITDLLGQARLGKVGGVLPGVTYDVTANFEGTLSYFPPGTLAVGLLKANSAPVCTSVVVKTNNDKPLWPTNDKFVGLQLSNGYDADGDQLNYYFLGIHQDELVNGDPDGIISLYNAPGFPVDEAQLPACQSAQVRKERDGGGNGRTYEISFLVEDGRGGSCTGTAQIATVPHDQGSDPDDDPVQYNSLGDGVASCDPFTNYNQP